MPSRQRPYAIIGAGPAGMSLARAFGRFDVPYVVLERYGDVGGIWNPDHPGTPIYRSAHFISSRTQSGYAGYAMPANYPDYPSAAQILAYHRAFADALDLRRQVRFNTAVRAVRADEDGGWQVEIEDGETLDVAGVVCATGTNWDPNIPSLPGSFDGELRHAVTYTDPAEFRDRRVLVVGAGNSGCDIACDAAQNAAAAFISLRRGYHFVPKHIFGVPADVFAESGPRLPMWLTQPIFSLLLRLLVGDLTRLGLARPDHKIFETHPILNDQLLHHLRHGDIVARGDIERLDGDGVVFADGRRELVDLIILATGYRHSMPYLDPEAIDWRGSRPQLYLNLFSRRQPGLMALGFMETDGGAYRLFDEMANVLAQHAWDRLHAPEKAAQLDAIKQEWPDLSGGVRYLASDRHGNYVQHHAYLKALAQLRRRMGWRALSLQDLRQAPRAA